MNSPAHDIALFLSESGVGTWAASSGWSISANGEPSTPDDAITIYDAVGGEPDTDELDVFRPGIQVRVRSKSAETAYQKHVDIRRLLILGPVDAETSRFTGIVMTSDVASLGLDSNNRHLLTANYRSRRTEKET